jgi:hypothetical protein
MLRDNVVDMLKTPLDVYKFLPKYNCGKCLLSTCIAFATAVIRQEKKLVDCTHIDNIMETRFEGKISKQINLESIQDNTLKQMKEELQLIDISSRTDSLGARWNGNKLSIKCFGRDFEIDRYGNVTSQCHTHAWISIPILHYILCSKGVMASGVWVPFRELEHGKSWNQLFERKCEQPLKHIADTHMDLFEDVISIFSRASTKNNIGSDISVIMYPLPKLPMMICYWKPEDNMESKLHLFFDDTAEMHLPIELLYSIGMGFTRMLDKIMQKHSNGMD